MKEELKKLKGNQIWYTTNEGQTIYLKIITSEDNNRFGYIPLDADFLPKYLTRGNGFNACTRESFLDWIKKNDCVQHLPNEAEYQIY